MIAGSYRYAPVRADNQRLVEEQAMLINFHDFAPCEYRLLNEKDTQPDNG